MGIGATQNTTTPSCYEKIIDKISQEKGISKEEAKAQFDAKLSEIAKKNGITVDQLKQKMTEGKCRKGIRKPLDEAKLKEIAEKKGITVEELKKQISEGKFRKEHRGQLSEEKLKEIAEKKGITVEELKQRMKEHQCDKAKALQ